ncbi:MAG: hypothetical protein V3U90_06010 [Dehalococcoidia bacterium]
MITVPGFLLRRLYVKGSLRNNEEGFEYQIKNSLGAGYAHRMLPLKVDEQDVPIQDSYFTIDAETTTFSAVSHETPFSLAMGTVTTIYVKGITLDKGPHKIAMGFVVKGLGELKFDFTDEIKD